MLWRDRITRGTLAHLSSTRAEARGLPKTTLTKRYERS